MWSTLARPVLHVCILVLFCSVTCYSTGTPQNCNAECQTAHWQSHQKEHGRLCKAMELTNTEGEMIKQHRQLFVVNSLNWRHVNLRLYLP